MKRLTLDEYNAAFRYQKDKVDGWAVTTRGDCDDYALSVAWIVSGHSWLRFWIYVLTFQITFWRVHTGRASHIVLRWRGEYIDNIEKRWRGKHGYRPIFPWIIIPPVVLFKMIVGQIAR